MPNQDKFKLEDDQNEFKWNIKAFYDVFMLRNKIVTA